MRPQVCCSSLRPKMAAHLVAILLLLVGCLDVASADKLDRPRYRTAYACEGNLLTIQCDEGHIISLIRANYGRFSITVCNQHGISEFSVNCMSNRSFRVLQEKCSQQNSCSIQASTQVFGDPCPGTWKYLEAHYQCLPASTTTSSTTTRRIPPWFITTTPSDWLVPVTQPVPATTKTTTSSTTTTTTTVSVVTAVPSTPSSTSSTTTTTVESPDQETPVAATMPPPTTTSTTTTVPTTNLPTTPVELQADYCAPIRVRDLQWNWTKKGEISAIPCPGGSSGYAKWRCGTNPVKWTPENPDLSGCKSAWLSAIVTDQIDQGVSVVKIAGQMAQATKEKPMYGGDVVSTTAVLKKMASKVARYPLSSINKEEIIEELMQSVIETSSNLLDPQHRASWNDLSRREQMKAATSLLVGLEENAYLLADQVNYEKVLVKADRNVMMSVKVYEVQNVREIHFPTNEDLNNVVWDQAADSIMLPPEAVLDTSERGLVKVVFFTFSNLEELLQPFHEDSWLGEVEHSQNTTRILNTRIISASIGRGRHVPLRQPAIVTLRHLREDNVSNPICAFWNYDTNSWSDDGCKVVSANRTHTVCSCDHLTNFAVLMDVQGIKISPNHALALQMITYIGCIISIVCLAFSFFTFTVFRGLKSDRTTIHKNLCMCLLIAEVIFLLGIGQTDKPILCGVVAGLLHFFFLCAFAWMFLEGFQLYVMLIEVFESEKSRIRWYYVLAYAIPALIVAVSCVIDPLSYGTERYCWLRTDNYFIFSFVGPVIVIIAINFVFLSIAIFMMCKHANQSAAMKNKEQSKIANIRAWLRGALVLVFLLGLTWTFGLLYLNEESIVMAYAFTVLNSLQGLFIFIFHCVQNDKVQKEYKKLLRRSQCLPNCVKDGGKERRSSFYVHSNGTASIPNSTSTSAIQQSNFKRLWGSQNGRAGSGRSSISKSGTPPGLQPSGLPDLEVEKASCKSSNRDSGHGGSDHEDSSATNHSGSVRYNRAAVDYGGLTSDLSSMDCSVVDSDFLSDYCQDKLNINRELQQQQQQQQLKKLQPAQPAAQQPTPQHATSLVQNHLNRLHRPNHRLAHQVRLSPLNHIYMDIDGREGEPVYEEIEHHRHEPQISDVSDEDTKRRSDISRQSSGSYGDNRPLIPQTHGLGERERHHERERNMHNLHGHPAGHHHHHHHYHPRTTTRGRPPPPPEPSLPSPSLNDMVHPSDRGDCLSPDMNVHSGMPLAVPPPQHPSVYYCSDTTNKPHQQPQNLPSDTLVNEAGVAASGLPQDARYPNDNALFVAMLDGRKVVCRLQPQLRKDPNTTYRTNSFSEC